MIQLMNCGKGQIGTVGASLYLDCRIMWNPYRDPILGHLTGDDPEVQQWIEKENDQLIGLFIAILMGFAMGHRVAAVLFVGLLGTGAFATVSPRVALPSSLRDLVSRRLDGLDAGARRLVEAGVRLASVVAWLTVWVIGVEVLEWKLASPP